jgi:hypothetical protein
MQVLLNLLQAKCVFTLTVIYLKTGKTSTIIQAFNGRGYLLTLFSQLKCYAKL